MDDGEAHNGRLLDRERECAAIDCVLDAARRGDGAVLALHGRPGIGTSALLAYGRRSAAGMRQLAGAGAAAEAGLAFAALQRLTRPVADRIDGLPRPQRTALRRAFGLAAGEAPDPLLAGVAFSGLLAAVARERPLLCVVDDTHRLDGPSAEALAFAARRLEGDAVALLVAGRERPPEDIPALAVGGVRQAAACALALHGRPAGVAPEVLERILAAADGNPLALVELPRVLGPAQLAGEEPIEGDLPLGQRLRARLLEPVRALPERTQTVLLLAAADDRPAGATALCAASRVGAGLADLVPAELAGLVSAGAHGVAFHPPLLRVALYENAPFAHRRAAHRALADTLRAPEEAERRAWHLAAGAVGPDERLAAELEAAAVSARRRGGFVAAGAALKRAADLSASPRERARRLTAAAEDEWSAGHPGDALGHLAVAGAGREETAAVSHLRGTIELRCGVPARAGAILLAAAAECAAAEPSRALRMFMDASEAASYAGDREGVLRACRAAQRLAPGRDAQERFTVLLLAGIAAMLEGRTAHGAAALHEAVAIGEGFDDPRAITAAGTAARYLGDDAAASRLYARAVVRARDQGAVSALPYALEHLALMDFWAGRWLAAAANAAEGLALARETGQDTSACRHTATLALLAAVRGSHRDCRRHAREVLRVAGARSLGMHAAYATWATALLELGTGRHGAALTRLETLQHAGGSHPVVVRDCVPDLVEAAVRAGRRDTAAEALGRFDAWAGDGGATWARALAARCRALLADDDAAGGLFAEALELHAAALRPFDRARTELLCGERLRRSRRRSAARTHLRRAVEGFEQLGARPWAAMARAELRAAGESARPRVPETLDRLTPQERRVARLVAEGSTNREVAARLFISSRTVDHHLRNVFVKLGIASRAELIRLDPRELGSDAA